MMKLSKMSSGLFVVLLAAVSMTSDASAGGPFAEGSACESQDRGDRLSGPVHITFEQTTQYALPPLPGGPSQAQLCHQPTDVEATIRLQDRNGNLRTYFSRVHIEEDVCNPCTVIKAFLADATLMQAIRDDFFSGESRTIGVRELSALGSVNELEPAQDPTQDAKVRIRTLADVVVTAQ